MRPFVLWGALLLAVGVASGQSRSGETSRSAKSELEPPPRDIAEARKLHAPPRVVVDVRTLKLDPKSGRCKDPICLTVELSYLAFKSAFPDYQDVVKITLEDGTRFEGNYEVGGRLLQGRIISSKGSRLFTRMELKQLGRSPILEVARQGPGSKAKVEPVPIEPQGGFVDVYWGAMTAQPDVEKRIALLNEARGFLRAESLMLMRRWLEAPGETEEVRAKELASVCDRDEPFYTPEQLRSLAEIVRSGKPGPDLQGVTLYCLRDPRTRALPIPSKQILDQLVSGICQAEEERVLGYAFKALTYLYYRSPAPRFEPVALTAGCERPERRAMLRTCLQAVATREEYAATFKLRNETMAQTWRCLETDKPEYVEALEEALLADPNPERMETLVRRRLPPTERIVTLVAERYAKPSLLGKSAHSFRATSLKVFHGVATRPELTAKARTVLREALKRPDGSQALAREQGGGLLDKLNRKLTVKKHQPVVRGVAAEAAELRVALVVLGEAEETVGAAAGVGEPIYGGLDYSGIGDTSRLVQYGLNLVGCSRDEISAAARASRANPKPAPGPFCASQKQGRGEAPKP